MQSENRILTIEVLETYNPIEKHSFFNVRAGNLKQVTERTRHNFYGGTLNTTTNTQLEFLFVGDVVEELNKIFGRR